MATAQELIDALIDIGVDDDRIRGIFLSGSRGSGEDDDWSDVDTIVAVATEDFDEVLENWPDFAAQFGTLHLIRQLFSAPIWTHVLHDWVRWDVTLIPADEIGELPDNLVVTLFNKDDIPLGPDRERQPAPKEQILEMTEEFVRVMGLLPVAVGRDDIVLGMSGAGLIRNLTIGLFVTLVEGDQPGGALHPKRTLPPEAYAQLAALPAIEPTMASVIAVHQACWKIFLPQANAVLGDDFPADLVQACSEHLSGQSRDESD